MKTLRHRYTVARARVLQRVQKESAHFNNGFMNGFREGHLKGCKDTQYNLTQHLQLKRGETLILGNPPALPFTKVILPFKNTYDFDERPRFVHVEFKREALTVPGDPPFGDSTLTWWVPRVEVRG